MSKEHKGVEKPEAHQAGEAKKADHKPADNKAEHKAEHKTESKPSSSRGKMAEPLPGACHAWHCKAQAKQFNFCEEHFDHFKFGLIKKNGEPVSDYEKKIEHYMAHKKNKKTAQKVA
jgi:hypothetical protein